MIIKLIYNKTNSLINRNRTTGWIRKQQDPSFCDLQDTQFWASDRHIKVKGRKKVFKQMGRGVRQQNDSNIRQNRLQVKTNQKRHIWILYLH